MSPRHALRTATATVLLTAAIGANAETIVIQQGADVDVQNTIDPGPQGRGGPAIGQDVQDFSDGSTDEGGVPEVSVDARDAALRQEKNLGPNAPGYIP